MHAKEKTNFVQIASKFLQITSGNQEAELGIQWYKLKQPGLQCKFAKKNVSK